MHDLVAKLKQLPELADVATDQQLGGVAQSVQIDRATASRFGITPQTIDNTLYDAFGQRQINTLYTEVNQYHVILETDPQFQLDPRKLDEIYIQSSIRRHVLSPPRRRLPIPRVRRRERARAQPPRPVMRCLSPSFGGRHFIARLGHIGAGLGQPEQSVKPFELQPGSPP